MEKSCSSSRKWHVQRLGDKSERYIRGSEGRPTWQESALGSGGGWCRQQGAGVAVSREKPGEVGRCPQNRADVRDKALAWLSTPVPLLIAQGLFQTSSYSEYYPYFLSL